MTLKRIWLIIGAAVLICAAVGILIAVNSRNSEKAGYNLLDLPDEADAVSVTSMPDGYSFYFEGRNETDSILNYLKAMHLTGEFPENPDEYNGMTWVITIREKTGGTQTLYHFGNMFISKEDGPWYRMDYEEAADFERLLSELDISAESAAGDGIKTAYYYVQYVDKKGFFGDDTFVEFPGADGLFHVFDTLRVDYTEENISLTEGKVMVFGKSERTYHYLIKKPVSVRRSDYSAGEPVYDKPVIYLYPEERTEVNVRLDFDGRLTRTIPVYTEDGWTVTADPDGTIRDADGSVYPYLFWEGVPDKILSGTDDGFCVKGEDTGTFFENILPAVGLNENETAEFISYWLPRMENNPYNLISFRFSEYTDQARLAVTPAPDSVLRVFMTYRASEKYADLKEQSFAPFERCGFTVVEWGGCELTK